MAPKSRPPLGRFLEKVDFSGKCWLWTGAKNGKGYGALSANGKSAYPAHRWSYEYFIGPIPAEKQIDHLCRVHECVNPLHLDAVTVRENLMRGNTLARRNKHATHCIHGHEFTNENTGIDARGDRFCKACKRQRTDRWQKSDEGRAYHRKWKAGELVMRVKR